MRSAWLYAYPNFYFQFNLRINNAQFNIHAKFDTPTYDNEKLIQRFILQHNQPPHDSMCYSLKSNSAVLPFRYESKGAYYIPQCCFCPNDYVFVEKNISIWSDADYMALMFFWNLQRELLPKKNKPTTPKQ